MPRKFSNEGGKKAEENTLEKDNESRKRQEIESQREREDTRGHNHMYKPEAPHCETKKAFVDRCGLWVIFADQRPPIPVF